MNYILFFLTGMMVAFGFVIYAIINNLPTLTNTYYKANMYDCNKEAQEVYVTALQISIQTATRAQQIYTAAGYAPQNLPSPTGYILPQNTQYQGTDGRTDAGTDIQNEGTNKPKEIKVLESIQKAGKITTNQDYVIFTRNVDNAIFRAIRPYEDDIALNSFEDEDGYKIGYYAGLCQKHGCYNIFVTTDSTRKFCDEKCRKQQHRN